PVGRIDFLASDKKTKDFVVIELKIGKPGDSAIGQLLRYVGYVNENLAKNKKANVRGILLAQDIDKRVNYALTQTPHIQFIKYTLNIKLDDVPIKKTNHD
ncbi:MAG: PDDEXK nuclease domain-containing protein, partial [Candidatus Methanomethylicia archaeon]|nr:PDDEXK nuclease domain-containing protein [Candidatus Methanomethylicia archaeon]